MCKLLREVMQHKQLDLLNVSVLKRRFQTALRDVITSRVETCLVEEWQMFDEMFDWAIK